MSKRERSIRFFITIHQGCEQADIFYDAKAMKKYLLKIFPNDGEIVYAIWAEETTPSTSRGHIHLYIEFKNSHSYKAMVLHFKGAHIDVRADVPPATLHDYVVKDGGTAHSIGEYDAICQKRAKRKRKTADDIIQEMTNTYSTFEECVMAQPCFAQSHKEAILTLFSTKKKQLFQNDCVQEKAETGEIIYFAERIVTYITVPEDVNIVKDILFKYGNDVSFVNAIRGKVERFDDYSETQTLVLNAYDGVIPLKDIKYLSSETINFLPCRFYNKPNLAKNIIVISEREFPYFNITKKDVNKVFTGGIWTIEIINNQKILTCILKGIVDDIPLSNKNLVVATN